ncbi:MAG: peptidoglycan-binding domain-containing protein [Rickettsiales bacterium]
MFLPSDITLQFGDSGDFVAEMQRRLVAVQGGSGNLVTGHFDGMTVNAVSSFQSMVGLRADGIAGPDTLRRLNGVYSGDPITSSDSSGNKNEEEEKAAQAATQFQHQALLAADAMAMSPQPLYPTEQAAAAVAQTAVEPAPEKIAALEPLKPVVDLQAQMQQQIQRDAALQTPPVPKPSDLLAQMLLDQPKPAPSADAALRPPTEAQPPLDARPPLDGRPPLTAQPVPQFGALPPGADPAMLQANTAPRAANQELLPPEQARRETTLTREQTPSLIQRGVQMANAMLQKIADYFEATLPDSVLKEVQAAGKIMARSGVKEVAIPTGPDLPARGPETPARGPETAQVQQRS